MLETTSSPFHSTDAPFVEGQIYHRKSELHDVYGGQHQSGIATCGSPPYYIFLFISPSGEEYGYRDDWVSENIYVLTGQGQRGDMEMKRGNEAILKHGERQRDLHLFTKVSPGHYKYMGQFEYDSHDEIQGKDVDGNTRKIIQFKLRKL